MFNQAIFAAGALQYVEFQYGNPGDASYVGPMEGNILYTVVQNGVEIGSIVAATNPEKDFSVLVWVKGGHVTFAVRYTDCSGLQSAWSRLKRSITG